MTPYGLITMLPFFSTPVGLALGCRVAFHGLELRQRDNICTLRPVPHGDPAGRVVVVEPAALGVKKLPPLVAISLADGHVGWRVPATLSCGQIHVHALL